MGKGDKKTRRGKITRGSYGILRKRKKGSAINAPGPDKSKKGKSAVKDASPAKETKATKETKVAKEIKVTKETKAIKETKVAKTEVKVKEGKAAVDTNKVEKIQKARKSPAEKKE